MQINEARDDAGQWARRFISLQQQHDSACEHYRRLESDVVRLADSLRLALSWIERTQYRVSDSDAKAFATQLRKDAFR